MSVLGTRVRTRVLEYSSMSMYVVYCQYIIIYLFQYLHVLNSRLPSPFYYLFTFYFQYRYPGTPSTLLLNSSYCNIAEAQRKKKKRSKQKILEYRVRTRGMPLQYLLAAIDTIAIVYLSTLVL